MAPTQNGSFDVAGARKAGYSNDEILSHLTATRKFDVAGATKAGYSQAEIINHMSSAPSQAQSIAPPLQPTVPIPPALQGPSNHSYGDATADFATNILGGAATGLEHTAYGTADMLRDGLLHTFGRPSASNKTQLPLPSDYKPGYYLEQGAEFMAPEMLLGKAAKLGAVARAGRAALSSGAVSAMQTGGDVKTTLENAALGGAGSLGGDAIAGVAKRAGGWLMNNGMEMSRSVLAKTNPGQYAIENGVFSQGWNPMKWDFSKEGMREAGGKLAGDAMDARDSLAAASKQRIDLTPAKDIATDVASRAAKQNNEQLMGEAGNLYDSLNTRKVDITGIDPKIKINNPVTNTAGLTFATVPRNPNVSVTEALAARQGLGAAKPWNTNNFFTGQGTATRNQMYGELNQQLHTVPGMETLDQTYQALAPFGKSIDNKPSTVPGLLAMNAGAMGGGGMLGAVKGLVDYGAGRVPAVPYYGARAAQAAPGLLRGLASIGMVANDSASLANPFLNRAAPFNPADNHGTNQQ